MDREGTPERDWPDWTHRITAKALQARGLVEVRGHGATWTAIVTERGKRVLAREEDVPVRGTRYRSHGRGMAKQRVPSQGSAQRDESVRVDPADLIADLIAAPDHTHHVADPDSATRAAYRRAIAGIPSGLVPAGKRVTHTGRDSGDLVIGLVDIPDPVTPDPPVEVPSSLDFSVPIVAWLIAHPEHLQVNEASRERALRIIQGVTVAIEERGYSVAPPSPAAGQPQSGARPGESLYGHVAPTSQPDPATFEVTIGDQVSAVDLYEEKQRVATVPPEEVAKLRFDWQRATPIESWQFSGRLALRIHGHAASQGWADRKRWTVESRLPRFVKALEEVAQARAEAHQRSEAAKRRRLQEWREALPRARAAYLADLNRERLDQQIELFGAAQRLRAYADAVSRRAAELDPTERSSAKAWADWIRAEADRHDPTLRAENLVFVEPEGIRGWELDKYMPRGFRAPRPPD